MEGIVTKVVGNVYTVRIENGELVPCFAKGNLRIQGLKSTNPITVGDRVKFTFTSTYHKGLIHKILERKNYIIRKSINLSKQYHIIAANVDQAILVVTLIDPPTSIEFIDRYLVGCEALRIPAVLVFNKIDSYNEEQLNKCRELEEIYSQIGYPCLETSVNQRINIDKFKDLISGKISVLNGHSGVGKSSLIKAIAPDLEIKIGDISEYHRTGKHVTSFSQMYEIFEGAFIIDTPGIKGFGLVDIEKNELYHFFPEIFRYSSQCKYHNCTHIHEPECAVVEAVRSNKISYSRYQSYVNIYFDENEKYRSPF
ncbi:MAG: ribosome small subunit-dependent GTPase A [Bacteroidales bacterium]|nr:ribosome small subunit-dependent GTPase A [Bacteroidales bacterium]